MRQAGDGLDVDPASPQSQGRRPGARRRDYGYDRAGTSGRLPTPCKASRSTERHHYDYLWRQTEA
jgi:hypothetical protein